MLVTLFCPYFGEKPAEKMDRGHHMSQRRGDFFILNENPTQCRDLADFVNPLPGGGGHPDPLTNESPSPPPPSTRLPISCDKWGTGCGFYGEQVAESAHNGINRMKHRYADVKNDLSRLEYIMNQHLLSTNPKAQAIKPSRTRKSRKSEDLP